MKTESKTKDPVKDHSIIRPIETPPKPAKWIPRSLRSVLCFDYNLGHEIEAKRYGYYPMIALKDIILSGQWIHPGERFTTTGNVGHQLWLDDDAEFVSDGRREKEEALEKAAAELKLPINYQTEPAFMPRQGAPGFPKAKTI